jgi:hypothetical protein
MVIPGLGPICDEAEALWLVYPPFCLRAITEIPGGFEASSTSHQALASPDKVSLRTDLLCFVGRLSPILTGRHR